MGSLRPGLCMVVPLACLLRRHIHDGLATKIRKIHFQMTYIESWVKVATVITWNRLFRVVSDMLSVTCKWRYCCRSGALHGVSGVPIVVLMLFCSSGFWLHLFVARLRLVEVFAVVPLGAPCFLSGRSEGCFVPRENVGTQAGCFDSAFGYRRPPRHARTSRVLDVGSQ